MQRAAYVMVGLSSMVIAGVLAFFLYHSHSGPQLTTPFQAVQMSNGQVFFGRLSQAGSAYPALHEVYLLQGKTNPETKQVTNFLVKRAQDWQGEDAIFLNARHIMAVEAVKPGSSIDKLIQDSRKGTTEPSK